MGFRFERDQPNVLSYKVSPAAKQKADALFSEARKRVIEGVPRAVPGLRKQRVRDDGVWFTGGANYGLSILFDDFASKMACQTSCFGIELGIHLPSLGYMIQVSGAKQNDDGVVSLYADPAAVHLVRREFEGLIRRDPRAEVVLQRPFHQR
jgi:hypothetical protein